MTLTILGGQSNAVYDLFATSELRGSNTVWTPLGQGQNSNTCSFSGQTNACATYLVAARLDSDNDGLTDAFEKLVSHSQTNNADSDHDGLPDAWEWTHFGTFSQTASGDYDHDGTSNSAEYQYRWDPNTISYQLGFANDHFAGTTLTGAVDLLGGVPVWMTCLVDSTNFAAAACALQHTVDGDFCRTDLAELEALAAKLSV